MELYLKNGVVLDSHSIAIQDRAFQYGDGCFTTAKIQLNQILLWSLHLQRLQRDCGKLLLAPNWRYIEYLIEDMKKVSPLPFFTGIIKIIVSRGEGTRGYGFSLSKNADVYILFYPNQAKKISYSEIATDVLALPIATQLMPALVGVKSLNRLEQVLLKYEANSKGFSEALVVDHLDRIIEGVSSNCFLHINGVWYTPRLSGNGVHGVMRREILSRMCNLGIVVYEADVFKHMLNQVDALFFCNALCPMQAVSTLSGRDLTTSITQSLFSILALEQL